MKIRRQAQRPLRTRLAKHHGTQQSRDHLAQPKAAIEAVRRLRSLRRDDAKAVPIVAMTADAYERDIRQCLDVGMNAHMAKPVDMGVLMKILERYLSV